MNASNISIEEVKRLISNGNVVYAHPRKGIVVVDGFRKYKASPAVIAYVKANG